MGAAGEFVTVTDAVTVGITAQTVAIAIEPGIREVAPSIVTQGEEVEVAGRRVGASRSEEAVPIVSG